MSIVYFDPVKPHGTLTIPEGRYVRLDVPKIVPPRAGLIHHELYLNLAYRLHHPDRAAKVRVKLLREPYRGEPEDPTSYQGYWLMPGFNNLLVTRVCFERAEAHRPCHWEVRVDGGTAVVGTRYAKAVMP